MYAQLHAVNKTCKLLLTSLSGLCPVATVTSPFELTVKYGAGSWFSITNVKSPPSGSLALIDTTAVPVVEMIMQNNYLEGTVT